MKTISLLLAAVCLLTASFADARPALFGRSYVRARYTIDTPKQTYEPTPATPVAAQPVQAALPAPALSPETTRPTPPKKKPAVAWRQSLASAKAESRKTGRPIWLHFTAGDNSCKPCLVFDKQVLADPVFITAANDLTIPVRILTEQDRETVKRYGVTRQPTDIVEAPSGNRSSGISLLDADRSTKRIKLWAKRHTERSILKKP